MKTNTHIVPFFNKAADLKVGLNQLGLRNASEALFTLLLSKCCYRKSRHGRVENV